MNNQEIKDFYFRLETHVNKVKEVNEVYVFLISGGSIALMVSMIMNINAIYYERSPSIFSVITFVIGILLILLSRFTLHKKQSERDNDFITKNEKSICALYQSLLNREVFSQTEDIDLLERISEFKNIEKIDDYLSFIRNPKSFRVIADKKKHVITITDKLSRVEIAKLKDNISGSEGDVTLRIGKN